MRRDGQEKQRRRRWGRGGERISEVTHSPQWLNTTTFCVRRFADATSQLSTSCPPQSRARPRPAASPLPPSTPPLAASPNAPATAAHAASPRPGSAAAILGFLSALFREHFSALILLDLTSRLPAAGFGQGDIGGSSSHSQPWP
ncbi:hypothetical protein EJ06DRAFT_107317 [Trichodelitschia bisporula]|uniref:Uncharacterized protein n=1 Tax=Trichodelitschia bisporula TaxID=703511 RepID=A0A6G1HQZ0_9PEZI|nr:hypothetical protein EJ06DRAFT_107317 [Trichodelitschia bisporula]